MSETTEDHSAADLPEGSVVATGSAVWIKTRSAARPWMSTMKPAAGHVDEAVDAMLSGGAVVLRVGNVGAIAHHGAAREPATTFPTSELWHSVQAMLTDELSGRDLRVHQSQRWSIVDALLDLAAEDVDAREAAAERRGAHQALIWAANKYEEITLVSAAPPDAAAWLRERAAALADEGAR
jgi:hypothetical protein